MRSCVVVPARNEEGTLAPLMTALAGQRDLQDRAADAASYEVLLLLNNCTDRTAAIARELQQKHSRLQLHVAEVSFAPHEAHVGRARQALFDMAFTRFQLLHRRAGLILTTDADSRPAADWIAQTEAEIAAGVVGVGGRILLEPGEQAALLPAVRRLFLLDIGYRRALEELRSLYAPETHDPFPRHHQHFGASLAVTAAAYAEAGGMPLTRTSEDVALYRAIVASGARFRHSHRVQVYTSARVIGRAEGGLAEAIGWWHARVRDAAPVLVESPAAAEARLLQLGLWCRDNPASVPPAALTVTPEPPPGQAAELQATLRTLRTRIEALRPLSLAARLEPAPPVRGTLRRPVQAAQEPCFKMPLLRRGTRGHPPCSDGPCLHARRCGLASQ
jgi:Glycosyl transferase family 2